MKNIIIGAGSDLGVHIDGSRLGPLQLINDIKSFYQGDVVLLTQDETIIKSRNLSDRRKNEYEIEKFNIDLYNKLTEQKDEKTFPIVIGGDHSISIASVLASAKNNGNIGLIWFDAHPDMNTFESTVTGNIHGLPLAAVVGYKNNELCSFHDGNKINPSKTVIVGARSIDPAEKDNIRYSGVTIFTNEDIKQKGLEKVLEEAFAIASDKTEGIHISFDLDLIDPSISPGVSIPEFDGLTEEEAMKINEFIIKKINKVVSYDLVEYNPLRDENRKTEQIALNLLAQIIQATNLKK